MVPQRATEDIVTETTVVNDEHYQRAVVSLEHTLQRLDRCSEVEKDRLSRDLGQLNGMLQKLTSGRVEIVVFGEISTGK
jgi:hypothetical protein